MFSLSMHAKDNANRVAWEWNLWLTVRYFMAPLRKELLKLKVRELSATHVRRED